MITKNFIPTKPIYSKEKSCDICTHYLSEHDLGPCSRTMGHIILSTDPKDIIHQSVKCDCKGFMK